MFQFHFVLYEVNSFKLTVNKDQVRIWFYTHYTRTHVYMMIFFALIENQN